MEHQLPITISVQEIDNYPFGYLSNQLRIVLVLEGSLQMKFVSGTVMLQAKDVEIINSNEPVGLLTTEKNTVMIVSIQGEFAKKVYPRIDKMSLNCNASYFFPNRIGQEEEYQLKVKVAELTDLYLAAPTPARAVEIEAKTVELLHYLAANCNNITNVFKGVPHAELHLARFKNINDYMQDNMERKITLSDIANQEYVSMQYLANEFKKKYGLTFNEILSYYRVIYSVRLLLDTDLSMTEISERCGFSAPRYYYKYFKKHLLISPKEFRAQNKKINGVQNEYQELQLAKIWRPGLLFAETASANGGRETTKRVLLLNPVMTEQITRRLEKVARKSFSADIIMKAVNIPFGPDVLRTDMDEVLAEVAALEALIEHQGNYDGAIITCYSDLGVKIARKLLGIPIISIAEAAYYSAVFCGEQFSIITSGGVVERRLIANSVNRAGMQNRCLAIKSLYVDFLEIGEGIGQRLEKLVLECRDQDGADSVVLACASLAGMGDKLSAKLQIPIIDGVAQAAVFMEAMLSETWRKLLFPKAPQSTRANFGGNVSIKNIERIYYD